MKNIFLSFIFVAFAISSFAQSFSVDNKGILVPRFDNTTAIRTAMPYSEPGQLVYNDSLGAFLYGRGSTWTNVSQWTPRSSRSGSFITHDGNIITGSTVSNRRFQIQTQSAEFLPSFELYSANSTNQMRFTSGLPLASINQKFVGGATAATTSLIWNHVDLNFETETPLMSVQGNGDFMVNGFSKFGGSTAAFPAMKTMMLTGTTAASGLTTTVVHGLTASKIIGFQVIVAGGISSGVYVPSNHPDPGMTFFSAYDAGSVYITRSSSNGSQLISKPYKILLTYTN